jgi:hypothetical protein
MSRARLSEELNRLLPGEQWKRVREGILAAANYSGQRTDQLRQNIDEANRLKTGVLVNGTVDFTSTTNADLSGFAWVIDYQIFQQTAAESITVDAPDADFPRPDIFVGLDDGSIEYRAGTVDEFGNVEEPTFNPVSEVLLRAVTRNPDNTNDEEETEAGASAFVSKVATGTEVMQGSLAIATLAQGQNDYVRADPNGKLQVVRGDKAGARATLQGTPGWARILTINCDFTRQLNYGLTMELSAVESNDYQTAKLTFYIRFNSSGVIQDSSLLLFGKVTPARYKIVKIDTDTYELWFQHFTSLTLYVWRPLFSFGSIDKYTLYTNQPITSLPAGDQLDFVEYGGGTELDADIVDALEASLTDSPGTSNRYVTVNLLNSYAYVQEAPNDGKGYVRLSESWTQVSPYHLAQAGATDGQVLTWNAANGRYEPATPSGGGGGSLWTEGSGFIYRNTPVVIGDSSWSNSASLTVKGNATAGSWVFKAQDSSGSNLIALLNDRRLWMYSDIINIGNNPSGATGVTIKSYYTGGNSNVFAVLDSSNNTLFKVFANGAIGISTDRLVLGNPSSSPFTGITVKVPGTGFTFAHQIQDSTGTSNLDIYANGGIFSNSFRNGFGIKTGVIAGGSHFKGSGTGTGEIFVVQNGANQRAFEIRGNRQILMHALPISDPGLAESLYKYNDGTRTYICISEG